MEAKYGIGKIGFMPFLLDVEAKYGIGRIGFMPLLQGAEAKYGIGRMDSCLYNRVQKHNME